MSTYKLHRAKPYIPQSTKAWIMTKYREILDTGQLIQGKYVERFEKRIKEMVGVKHAIATSSCGTGLETLLIASKVKNKKFIVPTQTFAATINCVIRSGNKPLIVDVDKHTQCLSLDIIKKNITKDTVGVILVTMAGLIPRDIADIEEYCEDNNLLLFTDDAHSLGSKIVVGLKKHFEEPLVIRNAGSFGNAGVFSFYPSKIITTAEGGMITTNDDDLADRCRVVRNHGVSRNQGKHHELDYGYTCEFPSTNYRMSEFHAVLGLSQLDLLNDFLERRDEIACHYNRRLGKLDWLQLPYQNERIYQSWWQYIVKIKNKDRTKLCLLLSKLGIPTANAYQPLCHQQKIYKKYLSKNGFENAEGFINRIFSLPLYVELKEEEIDYVCDALELI